MMRVFRISFPIFLMFIFFCPYSFGITLEDGRTLDLSSASLSLNGTGIWIFIDGKEAEFKNYSSWSMNLTKISPGWHTVDIYFHFTEEFAKMLAENSRKRTEGFLSTLEDRIIKTKVSIFRYVGEYLIDKPLSRCNETSIWNPCISRNCRMVFDSSGKLIKTKCSILYKEWFDYGFADDMIIGSYSHMKGIINLKNKSRTFKYSFEVFIPPFKSDVLRFSVEECSYRYIIYYGDIPDIEEKKIECVKGYYGVKAQSPAKTTKGFVDGVEVQSAFLKLNDSLYVLGINLFPKKEEVPNLSPKQCFDKEGGDSYSPADKVCNFYCKVHQKMIKFISLKNVKEAYFKSSLPIVTSFSENDISSIKISNEEKFRIEKGKIYALGSGSSRVYIILETNGKPPEVTMEIMAFGNENCRAKKAKEDFDFYSKKFTFSKEDLKLDNKLSTSKSNLSISPYIIGGIVAAIVIILLLVFIFRR